MVTDSCTLVSETRDLHTGALLSQRNGEPGRTATDGQNLYSTAVHSVMGSDGNTINTTTVHAFAGTTDQWHVDLPGSLSATAIVLANGVVYVGAADFDASGQVFAISAGSGQIIWSSAVVTNNTVWNTVEVAGGHVIFGPYVFGL
jgi:outer membrane protein assembly factor BamB